MFKKVGESVTISLTITDNDGLPVSTDSPYVVIKDRPTGKYYTGLIWRADEYRFLATHVSNGVYTYTTTLHETGNIDITATSLLYPEKSNTINVNVYSEQNNTVYGVVGDVYELLYAAQRQALLNIQRVSDNLYFDPTVPGYVEAKTEIQMLLSTDQLYTYDFALPEVNKYILTAYTNDASDDTMLTIIDVKNSSSDIPPVTVSSSSLVSGDGTNCIVLDNSGIGVSGAEVSAFNSITRDKVNFATTNEDGSWSMLLKPGKYIFTFTKGGYEDASFERMVR